MFSDHLSSAREVLVGIDAELVFVEENIGSVVDAGLTDFYLMYSCDHAIVADSTFSWWAAWLSHFEGKVVVYPEDLSPWGDDWVPPGWVGQSLR